MDKQDMIALIQIFDAKEELEEIVKQLSGNQLAHGFDNGIIGNLSRVTDLIAKHSPIYDDDLDYENQLLGQTLLNKQLSYDERADIILGFS